MKTVKEPKVKTPKVKEPKTVTYHKTHSLKITGTPCEFEAVLDKRGVQFKLDGEILIPISLPPTEMVGLEKRVTDDAKSGYITDLVWGEEVTVVEDAKLGWIYVTPTE
jgi:hypothetical protein